MKKNYTHVTLVVDRSGSMISMKNGAEEGINALLSDQFKQKGKFTTTIVDFNITSRTIKRLARGVEKYTMFPDGGTALYDAVSDEIDATGRDLAALPESERPSKVVFVIVTDGEENSSRRATKYNVANKIKHQENNYGWKFVFQGAEESAWQGVELGITNTRSYLASNVGQVASYGSLSNAISSYRSGSDLAFADAISK